MKSQPIKARLVPVSINERISRDDKPGYRGTALYLVTRFTVHSDCFTRPLAAVPICRESGSMHFFSMYCS